MSFSAKFWSAKHSKLCKRARSVFSVCFLYFFIIDIIEGEPDTREPSAIAPIVPSARC